MVENAELTRDEPASGMVAAFTKAFRNYFNFKGRACRYDYWAFCFINIIICITLAIMGKKFPDLRFLSYVYAFLVFIPLLSIFVRRLHDINKSFFKWGILPLILLFLLLLLILVMLGMIKFSMDSLEFVFLEFVFFALVVSFIIVWEITLLVFVCFKGKAESNKYGAPIIEDDSHVRTSKWLIFVVIFLGIVNILLQGNSRKINHNDMLNLPKQQIHNQIDFDQNEPAEPIQIELKNIPGINVEQGTNTPEE